MTACVTMKTRQVTEKTIPNFLKCRNPHFGIQVAIHVHNNNYFIIDYHKTSEIWQNNIR